MSAYPKRHYTREEYFALERVGDARYEYWDGEIVCMSGGTEEHTTISGNIHGELYTQLKGRKCRAFTAEMPIKTPALPPYRYPDASALCGEPVFEKIGGIDTLVNPTVVFEVTSNTTENADRTTKRQAYQALPSVLEYLVFSQTSPHVTHYVRQGDGWERRDVAGLDATIALGALDGALALEEVYRNVSFGE